MDNTAGKTALDQYKQVYDNIGGSHGDSQGYTCSHCGNFVLYNQTFHQCYCWSPPRPSNPPVQYTPQYYHQQPDVRIDEILKELRIVRDHLVLLTGKVFETKEGKK